jgi:hypothetical protein
MDQYTRRIIGFGVHAGSVDGVALCRMFNRAIRGQRWMSKYLSSDNDPLYRFHQWQANLRVLELTEIKSIPYVPLSHPFVERIHLRSAITGKIGSPVTIRQQQAGARSALPGSRWRLATMTEATSAVYRRV